MNRGSCFAVAAMLALTLATNADSISGKVSGGNGVSVVYVDTILGKTFPAPGEHAVMDQKGLLFQPHVLVVQAGTTVDFVNSDKVEHNVNWPSLVQGTKKLPGKNLGTWPQGEKRSFRFDEMGVAALLCNVHPEMSAYVVVVPTPYHATSDDSGNYRIDNIPQGQYNVVAWREGTKSQAKAVSVAGNSKTDFNLTK